MAASDPPSEAGFLGTVLPPEQVCPHCNSPAAGERCDECGGRLTELQASAFTVAARPRPLPAGAVYGNAATCYLCGRRIEKDEPRFRRQVRTGRSSGLWVSRRSYGGGERQYYGLRTLCTECTRRSMAAVWAARDRCCCS